MFAFPELEPLESVTATVDHEFPYVPGLLSLREGQAVLAAWDRQWLQRPVVGVVKSRLCGTHARPGPKRGAREPLRAERKQEQVIGAVLRTRDDVSPVFVSPGNMIDVETSVRLTLACCTR